MTATIENKDASNPAEPSDAERDSIHSEQAQNQSGRVSRQFTAALLTRKLTARHLQRRTK